MDCRFCTLFSKRCLVLALLMVLALPIPSVAQQAGGETPVDSILNLVPVDAEVALVVPSLKILSDQITQCLEGMDRSAMLLGSRPIDQLKAATGFSVGINDAGGMAIVALHNPDDAKGLPAIVFVVPVSNSETFLQSSFTGHDGDLYTLASGEKIYGKTIGSHVALSSDAKAVLAVGTAANAAESWKTMLGQRGLAIAASGDFFLLGRPQGFERLRALASQNALRANLPFTEGTFAATILKELEFGVISIDFDPLALVIRTFGKFGQDSKASIAVSDTATGSSLANLPNKPFHLAFGLDVAGIGGIEKWKSWMQELNLPDIPKWLSNVKSVQFAAYPSPAGFSGGLLNDAVAVIHTSDPNALKASMRQSFQELGSDPAKREVKWDADRPVKDTGPADAYEIKSLDDADRPATQVILEQALFGGANRRGFVAAEKDAVLLTFSQRPAVLAAARDAAAKGGLSNNAAIKTMRQWMPQKPFFEAYIGLGQISQLVRQAVASTNIIPADTIPQVEPSVPPVGFAVAAGTQTIETATIIPSGVLAVIFDQVVKQAAAPAPAPDGAATTKP